MMNNYERQYDEYLLDIPDNHVETVGICSACGEEIYDYEDYGTNPDGFLGHWECGE